MARGLSQYMENNILDWLFKRTAFPTTPTAVQISLHSADPGDSGANELAATGGYTRVTFNTDANNSTNAQFNVKSDSGEARLISNKATIQFPTASANWNSGAAIQYIAIWDTAGTNCLFSGQIGGGTGVVVLNGNTLKFEDGDLVVTVD